MGERRRVYGMSGGPFEDLRQGWALVHLAGRVSYRLPLPHYWRRVDLTDGYVSLCGLRGDVQRTINGQRMIFHPGDFLAGRCTRCSLKRSREAAGRR